MGCKPGPRMVTVKADEGPALGWEIQMLELVYRVLAVPWDVPRPDDGSGGHIYRQCTANLSRQGKPARDALLQRSPGPPWRWDSVTAAQFLC